MARCACLASSGVGAARLMGCHIVLPGSSFISSTSATSISGLCGGEEPTEMTFGDEASILSPTPWPPGAVSLTPPPPPDVDVVLKGMGPDDCGVCAGSRTLMVTLLGVRVIGGTWPAFPMGSNAACSSGGVEGALAAAESVEASRNLSTDMLLYVRSPLSRRGRFLVAEESASSIESL